MRDNAVYYSIGAQASRWKLSSIQNGFEGSGYSQPDPSTWLRHNDRRAKTAWYIVDNLFYQTSGRYTPANITADDIKLHYVRAVGPQEVDPERDIFNETVFDLAYYPSERGPYNYNTDLTPDGRLKNPQQNWGGITREINLDANFDFSKIAYFEFWMMDPFISGPLGAIEGQVYNPASKGREGTLTLDLGDISEDVLRDSRLMFEQGLPVPGKQVEIDTTPFGKVPRAQIIQYGFDEDSYSRSLQDVGLDGLNNEEERSWFAG